MGVNAAGQYRLDCSGECSSELVFSDDGLVTLTTTSDADEVLRMNQGRLSAEGLSAIAEQAAQLTPASIDEQRNVTCPIECTQHQDASCPQECQGHRNVLELSIGGSSMWLIYMQPIASFEGIHELVDQIRQALSDCSSDDRIDVSADCSLSGE
jgi:hypothetical protein